MAEEAEEQTEEHDTQSPQLEPTSGHRLAPGAVQHTATSRTQTADAGSCERR